MVKTVILFLLILSISSMLEAFTAKNIYLTTNTLSSGTSVRPGFGFNFVWNGIGQSKAGKIYMAVSNNDETQGGGDVCVVEYNPYTNVMRSIGTALEAYQRDNNLLAGEYCNKVHTWLNGSADGKVWLGTQSGGRGSHLLYIDPATGLLRDYSRTQKYIFQTSPILPVLNHPELPTSATNGIAIQDCDFTTMCINPYTSRYIWTESYSNFYYHCWDVEADTIRAFGGGHKDMRVILVDKSGSLWYSNGGIVTRRNFSGVSRIVGRGLGDLAPGGSAFVYTHSYDSAFTTSRQSGLIELYDFVHDTAIPFADLPDGSNANSTYRAITISKDDKSLYILGNSGNIYQLTIATRQYVSLGSISGNLAGSYAFSSGTMDSLGNWYICTWGGSGNTYWVQVNLGKAAISPLPIPDPSEVEAAAVSLTRSMPLEVYPNPVRSQARIGLASTVFANRKAEISIFDQRGRLVGRMEALPEKGRDHHVIWNAGHLSSGLYLVRVNADGKSYARSVAVMR